MANQNRFTPITAGFLLLVSLASVLGVGCNSEIDSAAAAFTGENGNPASPFSPTGSSPVGTPAGREDNCVSSDPERICIGLKFVSYTNSAGVPSVSEKDAAIVVDGVNALWSSCNIAFRLEEYRAVNPADYGLQFSTGAQSETAQIRDQFSNDSTFLVAVTGSWNSSYVAWTAIPGAAPYGVVATAEYGTDPVTIGHELGHYLGLDHDGSSTNLLYPYVSAATNQLSNAQCSEARQTGLNFWKGMLRYPQS